MCALIALEQLPGASALVIERWLMARAKMADGKVAPWFQRGSWGRSLAEMNRDVDMLCGAALKALRR